MLKTEQGKKAICWFCEKEFVKKQQCEVCGFYVCPHCGKCGCQLTKNERRIVRICVATFLGIDYWKYWRKKAQ